MQKISSFLLSHRKKQKNCKRRRRTNSKIKICFYDASNHTPEITALFSVGNEREKEKQKIKKYSPS
jgi:hypothetical protein